MAFAGTISAFAYQVTDVIIHVLGGMYRCTFNVDRNMRERVAKGIELNLRDGCQFTNDDLMRILKPDGNKTGVLAMHGSRRIQQGIQRILQNAPRVRTTLETF